MRVNIVKKFTLVISKAKDEIFSNISNRHMDQNGSTVTLVTTHQQGPYIWGPMLKGFMEMLFSTVVNANISAIRRIHCEARQKINTQTSCCLAVNVTLKPSIRAPWKVTSGPNIRKSHKNAINVERCFTVSEILEYIKWTNINNLAL